MAVLCYLSVIGRRPAWVGALGAAVSLVTFVTALLLAWGALEPSEGVWRTFGISLALAASLAQICLLLALDARRHTGLILFATCGAVAVLAAMVCAAILDHGDMSGTFWRIFGVVAILDVLGTVVVSAMGALGRPAPQGGKLVSVDTETRLRALARERGISTDDLVSEALDAYLTLR